MNSGKLRHRIAFDEPITSQNSVGEEVVNFVEAFKLWGAVQPVNGRERLLGGEILAQGETRIRIRWSPQAARINAKWRARHQGTIYNIAGPPAHVDEARRKIEIMATSGQNAG